MDHPKLRPIEAFPVDLGGREVICLRDPTQLTDDAVFVPREALFILAHPAETVLEYGQAVEPATQSMVSYASVVFH